MPHGRPWEDPRGWSRRLLDERPRLLTFDLRLPHLRLRWAFPSWALEESLRGAALLVLWGGYALGRTPLQRIRGAARLAEKLSKWLPSPPWYALVALFDGVGDGMLALPAHEPLLHISVAGTVEARIPVI